MTTIPRGLTVSSTYMLRRQDFSSFSSSIESHHALLKHNMMSGIVAACSTVFSVATIAAYCESEDQSKIPENNNALPQENNDTEHQKTTESVEQDVTTVDVKGKTDAYENLPEEDEPTTCTICLINRQGPCRNNWRKFERCMKDHGDDKSSNKDDHADNLGEKCDKYMIPWLTCVQSRKNTYSMITNSFYQDEFVDVMEAEAKEAGNTSYYGNDMDPLSFLDLQDWFQHQSSQNVNVKEISSSEDKKDHITDEKNDSIDIDLIHASATINLIDNATGREIEIAYVRDQDGKLLGFEQFVSLKKERRAQIAKRDERDLQKKGKEMIENPDNSTNNIGEEDEKHEIGGDEKIFIPSAGLCNFNIIPGETKSIKVYALYRDDKNIIPSKGENNAKNKNEPSKNSFEEKGNTEKEEKLSQNSLKDKDAAGKEDNSPENSPREKDDIKEDNSSNSSFEKEEVSKIGETLFYSSLISLADLTPSSQQCENKPEE
eukprot:CAMPEP_0184868682 /NCGR_PEP_ID=MMETSP0580-20130426/31380_1 /TAXON_ID=1118495 /ORGANISM="Dactyliosolen fragilissimus" /LENGTH=487 /DNA_ID=CAMNT_0027369733 /DNA_START=53 /DNA_END=1516 /DNA_ORIENTATION=+